MNVNKVLTKDYEKMSNWAICENKPNSNPIQTQTKPISEAKKADACVFKPALEAATRRFAQDDLHQIPRLRSE